MSFGTALKQAREAQGLSTQDLALRTKIRGDYLRALEDGNTSLLPERTFARSYLQRYARELGLDPAPLLAEFDHTMPAAPEIAQGMRNVPLRDTREATAAATRSGPGMGAMAATLLGLLLLGGGAYYAYTVMQPRPAAVVTPPATPTPPTPAGNPPAAETPVTTPATPAPAATVRLSVSSVPEGARVYLDNRDLGVTPIRSFPVDTREQAELRVEYAGRSPLRQTIALNQGRNLRARLLPPGQGLSQLLDLNNPSAPPVASKPPAPAKPTSTTTPPATTRSAVSVSFTGESWTKVTDANGRILYQGTPPTGSVKGFPAGVIIRAGNAGAVKVSVNGKPAQPMGQSGQVMTKKF